MSSIDRAALSPALVSLFAVYLTGKAASFHIWQLILVYPFLYKEQTRFKNALVLQ